VCVLCCVVLCCVVRACVCVCVCVCVCFVFYIHPWEIDPDQPRIEASLRSRFRHYQNLRSTESKLIRMLNTFRFGTLSESLATSGVELPQKSDADDANRLAKAHRSPMSNVSTLQ